MWSKTLRFATCIGVFCALALDSHAATLIDTGAYLSRNSEVHWVSDDVVIFAGYDGSKGVPKQLRPPWPKPIYTARWFEYRHSTRRLTDRGLIIARGACFDGGFVRYAKPVPESEDAQLEGKWQPYYGKYGEEKPFQRDEKPRTHFVRTWECKLEDELPPLPAWANDKHIRRLRPGHGYVELTGPDGRERSPIRLIAAGGDPGNAIPIKGLEGFELYWPPTYEQARNTYLLGGSRLGPDGVSRYELWRLALDGKLEQLLRMGGDNASARGATFRLSTGRTVRFPAAVSSIVLLGKDRYLFSGGQFNPRSSDRGLYILEDGAIKKLAKGRVAAELAVSPSGCRAAAGIDPQEGPDQFRLHVVDACERD